MGRKFIILMIMVALVTAVLTGPVFAADKKVKVTVLPFSIFAAEDLSDYEADIQNVLLSALAYHEKIEPLDKEKLSSIIGDKPPDQMDEAYARMVGSKMGADYVVLGSMTKVGETISLDAKLVPVRGKKDAERFYVETYGLATVLDRVGDIAKKINEKIFADEIITKVIIRGNKRLPDEDIIGVIQSKEGTLPYDIFLAEDVKAITEMGYFSNVEVKTELVEKGTEVTFTVEERPLIREVRINGTKKIKVEDVFEVVTITPPKVLSTRDLKKSIDAIKALYEEKQFHAIKVEHKITPLQEDEILLEFNIEEGKKMMIKKIIFVGNDKISDRKLEKGLANKGMGLIWWFTDRGKYKKKELDKDIDRVTAVYFDNGYLDAVVEPPEVEMKEKRIFITYRIKEGERYTVGTVDMSGDLIRPKEEFKENLTLESGENFSRLNLIADLNYLTKIYNDDGYALVDIQPQTDLKREEHIANVNYMIVKGKKTYFEKINISGNIKTLDKVIRRELKFAEGDLFNGTDLTRSKEKVENLGYFEEVKFATEKGSADDKVVVKIDVKERPTGLISAGMGYSSVAKVTGLIRVQERNLFGRGYKVSASAEFSNVDTNYYVSLADPYFLDTNLAMAVKFYSITREYDTYDAETLGIELGAGHRIIDEETKLLVTYIFNRVTIDNIDEGAADDVWDAEGVTVTSGIETQIIRDTRDNVYDPSKGSVNSLSVFIAGIGGDEKYLKTVLESSWYFPVYWKLVFHPRLMVGWAENFKSGDLPIYARFYAGGLNTIRGFKPYSVGPIDPDTGEYLGGNKEVIVNLELLFPLFEDIKMKGVLFFDMGNVWGDDENMDLSDLRYSFGGGIRWYSPMGPIRVEWGYNLDPKPDESHAEWNFSIGTSF
ncbi:MAG: outer membrane protein assembly factor BamA [Deltaproteobacteria bacterium]|uniref:Outer membrane protein assembly factor BamA n=1 Tax=Candidatus Zymogenus saltonus TaxID=2844893 RepID=A0A9D8PNU7_9DELT|nr:outer membrane protein assembly factor BamA [Candidatus Zymogenus saltonus]